MQKAELFELVDAQAAELRSLAQSVWEHAEPAMQEEESAALLAGALGNAGFDMKMGIGGLDTAFVASYGDGGPTIGFLGEYDALPGLSQERVPRRQPADDRDAGHGCGHNLHGVGAVGGALAVKEALAAGALEGSVRYFGCPAEETLIGKVYMARAGAFDGLDAAMAWHPADVSTVRLGTANALNSLEYTFHGESAHAASQPQSGRSALDAVQLMNTGVEYLREHVPDEARIHYVISDGGDAPNVVPGTASVHYFVRSPTRAGVDRLTERVDDIAQGAALMTDTDLDRQLRTGCHSYAPNETVGMQVWENMERVGPIEFTPEQRSFAADLRERIPAEDLESRLDRYPTDLRDRIGDADLYGEPEPPFDRDAHSPGTADLGDPCWIAPTVQFRGASWPVGTPPHTWHAVAASGEVGLASLPFAAKVFAGTAWDLLRDPSLLAAAREEHEAMTEGYEYECAVPPEVDPPRSS